MPRLLSIQIGQPERLEAVAGETSNKPWTTAFYKRPHEGPTRVGRLGLEGDAVAETRVHGGPDKAVCVYSADRYPHWREELAEHLRLAFDGMGPDGFAAAAFGENFTVGGLAEDNVGLGDLWRIGTAVFQVSQPRQPCWKLARRWRLKDLTLRVQRNGYTGWYLRVLEEGVVEAGDPIVINNNTDQDRWTIARANHVMYEGKDDAEATAALAAVEPLAASWKRQLKKRL